MQIRIKNAMLCCLLLFMPQVLCAQISFSVKNQTIQQTIRLIEKEADYILALKKSQGTLYNNVELFFDSIIIPVGETINRYSSGL